MRLLMRVGMVLAGLACGTPAVSAAVQADVEVAEAELSGTLTVTFPRSGPHHIGVVYRDLIPDEQERYTLAVDDRPFADFPADIKPGALWGDDRLYVWFSEKPYEFKGGDKVGLKLAGTQKGPHQVFSLYFVKPAALEKVRGQLSRASLVHKDRRLFTRIVGASDGPGAKHYPLPESVEYLEVHAASAALEGFTKKKVSYTIWGQYVSVVGPASEVNLLTAIFPAPEGHTKPIVTFKMRDAPSPRPLPHGGGEGGVRGAGQLFGGEPFHVATRGTTRFLHTQLSPQFPGIPMTPQGTHPDDIKKALDQKSKGQPVRFGRPVEWDKNPTVWVVGRIGLDMYPEHAEATLKGRADLRREHVITAYLIRVSDGSADKTQWPLFYWNSWFHGSEGEIHNEEITRLLADQYVEPGRRLWFYYDWRPGEKAYTDMMRPRDVTIMSKGGIPGRWVQYGLFLDAKNGRVMLEPLGVWMQDGPLSIKDWIIKHKGAEFYQNLLKEAGER